MAKAKKVGRPKGKAKRTPDTVRIRKVLDQYGVTYPTPKVVAVLKGRNAVCKPADRVKINGALGVKIAQVRSRLIEQKTGLKRKTRGRRTLRQLRNVETRLAK
jgi:hypothetical protein